MFKAMDFNNIAYRLNELEYSILDAYRYFEETKSTEKLAEVIGEHNAIILSIRKYFINNPVALIPAKASASTRAMIQEILLTGKSPIDRVFEETALAEFFDYTPDSDDLEELAKEHFLSWFSHYDYVYAILETAALVLKSDKLPDDLLKFLSEIRQCYAFQQYLASILLCRTSLELGLYHKCIAEERLPEYNPSIKSYVEDFVPTFSIMREKLSVLGDFKEFDLPLRDLYHELSRYIHGQHHTNKNIARDLITRTFKMLHDLYEA